MSGHDEFIGYEIPVEVNSLKLPEGTMEASPQVLFNLDAIDGQPEQARFEMMEIHITLHNLSGVLFRRRSSDKRRRRNDRSRLKSRSGIKGGSTTSDMHSTKFGGTTLSTITESTGQAELRGFEADPTFAPTTAVVSSTRNDPSSQTPMETFIPSMPLHRLSRGDCHALRYHARWNSTTSSQSHLFEDEDEEDDGSSPTLKVLRLMHQQQYVRSAQIKEISMYEHEKIDLCVFVGRGKELIPLGVVSIIVTGDEETETILNLPIKKPATNSQIFERHFKPSKRKKGSPDYFENDPKHCFCLDENATLRVGFRAFPQRELNQADELSVFAREKEEQVFQSVLQNILDDGLLASLQEESSLVQKLVEGQKEQIKEDQENKVAEELQKEVAPTPTAIMQPAIFCNFSFFQNHACSPHRSLPSSSMVDTVPQQVVTINRDMSDEGQSNLPLTLVSSVSESISTEGGHSNTRFFNDRANK